MATFTQFAVFVSDLASKVHDLSADTIKVALSNTAIVGTEAVFADITEISAGNGYSSGGSTASILSFSDGPPFTVTFDSVSILAGGGAIGPLRYLVFYNDTPASNPLIGYVDLGSPTSVPDGVVLFIEPNNPSITVAAV